MTHQHAVCLSTAPRHGSTPYPSAAPLPQVVDDIPIPPIEINPVGEAVIEVLYPKDDIPSVLCRDQEV